MDSTSTNTSTPEWQEAFAEWLNPLQLTDRQLDQQVSFLIYGESNQFIIGWYIMHQMSPQNWQATSIFIQKKYRTANIGLAAIQEMAVRHRNRGRVHFMVRPDNTKMLAFVKRYMIRWGCELFRQEVISKQLGA
jgi:predicted acetyltransferase